VEKNNGASLFMRDQELLRDDARRAALRALVEFEKKIPYKEGLDIREMITGPIVDSVFEKGEVVSKTLKNGLKFSFRYSSKIARDFVMAHEDPPDHVWEPQTTKLLLRLAANAKNIVIGGAYFGDQAIMVAQKMSSDGICHCFEMAKENAALLAENARQNGISNLHIENVGLWSSDDARLTLGDGQDSHASAQLDPAGKFTTTTIDAYGRRKGIESIDLIMLDIEGAEFNALKGAENYLSQNSENAPAIVYEVHSSYVDWSQGLQNSEIVSYLTSLGYSSFAIRDYNSNVSMGDRPIELVEIDNVYLDGPPHGFNMVAVKRPEQLDAPGIVMCRGVSPKLLFHRDPQKHAPLK
jgi:FkbM family methyltransferase